MRKTRTIEYRKCLWLLDKNLNLESLLRDAWLRFPTQRDREVLYHADSIVGMNARDLNNRGFAIHCARFVDKQSVGVIPMQPVPQAGLGERPPEIDENFLNSDFTALIRQNHIVVMGAGMNAAGLREFLRGLFKAAQFDEDTGKFDLVRIADGSQVARIKKIGVKSVDLSASVEGVVAEYISSKAAPPKGVVGTILGGMANIIQDLSAEDDKLEHLKDAKDAVASIKIQIPEKDIAFAKASLDRLAEKIASDEDADDYLITLRSGEIIKPNQIVLKKAVSLRALANSVSPEDSWDKMQEYIEELIDTQQIPIQSI